MYEKRTSSRAVWPTGSLSPPCRKPLCALVLPVNISCSWSRRPHSKNVNGVTVTSAVAEVLSNRIFNIPSMSSSLAFHEASAADEAYYGSIRQAKTASDLKARSSHDTGYHAGTAFPDLDSQHGAAGTFRLKAPNKSASNVDIQFAESLH